MTHLILLTSQKVKQSSSLKVLLTWSHDSCSAYELSAFGSVIAKNHFSHQLRVASRVDFSRAQVTWLQMPRSQSQLWLQSRSKTIVTGRRTDEDICLWKRLMLAKCDIIGPVCSESKQVHTRHECFHPNMAHIERCKQAVLARSNKSTCMCIDTVIHASDGRVSLLLIPRLALCLINVLHVLRVKAVPKQWGLLGKSWHHESFLGVVVAWHLWNYLVLNGVSQHRGVSWQQCRHTYFLSACISPVTLGIGGFLPGVKQIANVASLPGIVGVSMSWGLWKSQFNPSKTKVLAKTRVLPQVTSVWVCFRAIFQWPTVPDDDTMCLLCTWLYNVAAPWHRFYVMLPRTRHRTRIFALHVVQDQQRWLRRGEILIWCSFKGGWSTYPIDRQLLLESLVVTDEGTWAADAWQQPVMHQLLSKTVLHARTVCTR